MMKSAIGGAIFALALGLASQASAQNLTSEQVAAGFVQGVALCAKAVAGGGGIADLPQSDRAALGVAEAGTREFIRAEEGRPVWDVLSAKGIVIIVEPAAGRCDVSAYGPRVEPTFRRIAARLQMSDLDFAEVAAPEMEGAILRRFQRTIGGRRIDVLLDGGEPGMPGRTFRFSLLLAFVGQAAVSP